MFSNESASVDAAVARVHQSGIDTRVLDWYPGAHLLVNPEDAARIDPESRDYYWMDPASLVPVLALAVAPGLTVGDFCAAPGGKALFIVEAMQLVGELVLNEFSQARLARLKAMVRRFDIPLQRPDWRLQILAGSARILPRQYPSYCDRILLDVPCSSEAHVLRDPVELARWSPSRSRELARRQRKLLRAAIDCLKPGGRLVYSTCSISPLENEDNMIWLAETFSPVLRPVPYLAPVGKPQRFGTQILPHRDGMGPAYVSVWERK